MIESDVNGWETYSELPPAVPAPGISMTPTLIKNMVFDLDVPYSAPSPARASTGIPPCCSDITLC